MFAAKLSQNWYSKQWGKEISIKGPYLHWECECMVTASIAENWVNYHAELKAYIEYGCNRVVKIANGWEYLRGKLWLMNESEDKTGRL